MNDNGVKSESIDNEVASECSKNGVYPAESVVEEEEGAEEEDEIVEEEEEDEFVEEGVLEATCCLTDEEDEGAEHEANSASDRSRSHSVESILTAKSFARNIPGLVHSLSDQEKIELSCGSLIKCITQRILDEVMPQQAAQRPAYLDHSIQLVVPGTVKDSETKKRYMVIMAGGVHHDPDHDEAIHEHAILGINISNRPADNIPVCPNHKESPTGCQGDIVVAMALPITKGLNIEMDGDGGIRIITSESNHVEYIFKPVNLQALWVSHSYLNSDIENARKYNFFPGSKNHYTWAGCYTAKVPNYLESEDQWEDNSQIEDQIGKHYDFLRDAKIKRFMEKIMMRMREIIMTIDLDNASCFEIRKQLETEFECNLNKYKRFLDEQIVKVFGQSTESPSKIFDYLYLGNEWNASNLPQLKELGITHVLNVTMEIANFFSHELVYKTIRVRDEESSDLRRYWDDTYNFIKNAKRLNKRVFVHCRMGVSRSASCVIAYIMKEYSMSIAVAQDYVKKIRSCVNPNPGFQRQLEEYNGILEARHNEVFGKKAIRRAARCPQIPEQKLVTERWIKEHQQTEDVTLFAPGEDDKENHNLHRIKALDGLEKVSEWMKMNDENGFEVELIPSTDPSSPAQDRVIPPDLLVQLNTDNGGAEFATPVLSSRRSSQLSSEITGFDLQMQLEDGLARSDIDSHMTDSTRRAAEDMTHASDDIALVTENTVVPDFLSPEPGSRDSLSADGPYSPADLEHEVAVAADQLTGGEQDCEIHSVVKDKVVHRIKANPSFRRSTASSGVVRNCVVQIEVRNEVEHYKQSTEPRNRVRSAGSAAAHNSKRTKKIKQTQSWADFNSAYHTDPKLSRKHKKDHAKVWNGGHKICASIKKIIERLLSPREKPPKRSVSEEIERVAEREGKIYDQRNRMSMPILESSQYILPKRRCQSGDFPPDVVVVEPLQNSAARP